MLFITPLAYAAVSDLYNFSINETGLSLSNPVVAEPKIMQADYRFVDENNNSLYDYLIVEPKGSIRVYDSFDMVIIATEDSKIDLKSFYLKKAEGPYRIVVDVKGSIYESITGNESYVDFEMPALPDLSVKIDADSIVIKNGGADAFNFFISIYEHENRTVHQNINYLKFGEEYGLDYSASQNTKVIVDIQNTIEESDEENNFAELSPSISSSKKESVLNSASSFALFKNALKIDESKPLDSAKIFTDQNKDVVQEDNPAAIQTESKKSNLLTGNVGLNLNTPSNKIASFIIIAASTFLLLYTYDFMVKKRRF